MASTAESLPLRARWRAQHPTSARNAASIFGAMASQSEPESSNDPVSPGEMSANTQCGTQAHAPGCMLDCLLNKEGHVAGRPRRLHPAGQGGVGQAATATLDHLITLHFPSMHPCQSLKSRMSWATYTTHACVQALPYNAGVDAGTVTSTIARAKERRTDPAPAPSANTPVATTIITTAAPGGKAPEPVEDVEIAEEEGEDGEGGPAAEAAAAARAASELAEVEALTALPQPEDELLYAVPMCAPYDALARCKFRVKLVPGSQRKGKASKQLLDLLVRGGDANARCAP